MTEDQIGVNPESEHLNEEDKDDDPDERSIFVKNVHFSTTAEELKAHFSECGEIKRVTIPIDKFTQKSKGFAYIEFENKDASMKAKLHNDSLFKGRQITVQPKRKNLPGQGAGRGGARNNMTHQMVKLLGAMFQRGGRGRGSYRGGAGRGAAK